MSNPVTYKGYVYLIYNKQNTSEYYIGSTTSTPNERLKAHQQGKTSNKFCMYLKKNIDVTILTIEEIMFEKVQELLQREDEWIWLLEPPLNTRMKVFELDHYPKKKKKMFIESLIRKNEDKDEDINDQRYTRKTSTSIKREIYELSLHFQVEYQYVNEIADMFKSNPKRNLLIEQLLVEYTNQTSYTTTQKVLDRYLYIKEICQAIGVKGTLDKETVIQNKNLEALIVYFNKKSPEDQQTIIQLFKVRVTTNDGNLSQCTLRNTITVLGGILSTWTNGELEIIECKYKRQRDVNGKRNRRYTIKCRIMNDINIDNNRFKTIYRPNH